MWIISTASNLRKRKKETLKKLEEGKIDIIIGTHALLGKDVKFKDLGVLIIDEEQKFGVAAKEKIRERKTNVDTLTLTATPIPLTLQFSLMSARDLSIINTPPPNRQPVHTELIGSLMRTRYAMPSITNLNGAARYTLSITGYKACLPWRKS